MIQIMTDLQNKDPPPTTNRLKGETSGQLQCDACREDTSNSLMASELVGLLHSVERLTETARARLKPECNVRVQVLNSPPSQILFSVFSHFLHLVAPRSVCQLRAPNSEETFEMIHKMLFFYKDAVRLIQRGELCPSRLQSAVLWDRRGKS